MTRRSLLSASVAAPFVLRSQTSDILGQGKHRYRVVPNWGVLDDKTPVKDCHGLVTDREGHIILLTNHTANNVLIYDKRGKLVSKWGTSFPGAHGLSIVREGKREILYLTDLETHKVVKSTLDGTILNEWRWPEATGKYAKEADYKPSWTLHTDDGAFYVLDGYGKDYIVQYDREGRFERIFGGKEGGITHWGPHGGMMDKGGLLIAMSDQQHLMRLNPEGRKVQQVDMPGGNPRQIRRFKGNYYVAHLADNWPKDRNSRGFVSILNEKLRVISNIAGSAPEYDDAGALRPMKHTADVFLHPHDLTVDREGSIYVAQFASNNTYPVKLERV